MLLTPPRASGPTETKARSFDETIALLSDTAGGQSQSGIYVSSSTAMRQSTVYACVRVLAEIIGQLPINVQTRQNGAWVTAEEHRIYNVLASPNDWQCQHDFISTLVAWSELNGNSFHWMVRNGRGEVAQMIPLGEDVTVEMSGNMALKYTVSSDVAALNGRTAGPERVFHCRNFGTKGYMGLSTIACHRDSIGLALQLEDHAANVYKNGLQSRKWVALPPGMKFQGENYDTFKQRLQEYTGSGKQAGRIPVMPNGTEFKEFLGMNAVDAQYIESRKFQKEDIATIFGVPVFLLNSTENTTWGTGLEQISRSFVRFSLNPRLSRLSQQLRNVLTAQSERRQARIVFDTDQFTLGEFKDRMEGYQKGIHAGVISPNEARDIEGRNPREGGDDYQRPINIGVEGEEPEMGDNPPAEDEDNAM